MNNLIYYTCRIVENMNKIEELTNINFEKTNPVEYRMYVDALENKKISKLKYLNNFLNKIIDDLNEKGE